MLGEDQTVGMAEKIDVSCAGCISHLRKSSKKNNKQKNLIDIHKDIHTICICICTCTCICICKCLCIYVCIYIYVYNIKKKQQE